MYVTEIRIVLFPGTYHTYLPNVLSTSHILSSQLSKDKSAAAEAYALFTIHSAWGIFIVEIS